MGRATAAAAAAVRSAPTATEAAGSASVAVKVSSDERPPGTTSGPTLSVGILAGFDFRAQNGQGAMTIGGLSGSGNPGQLRLVFTSSALYMQTTGRFSTLGNGKPWVKVAGSTLGTVFASAAPSSQGGILDGLATTVVSDPDFAAALVIGGLIGAESAPLPGRM